MSVCIDSYEGNGNYCELSIERAYNKNFYRIHICKVFNTYVSYPFKSITYSINDEKKAKATFKRYVKKYCIGE